MFIATNRNSDFLREEASSPVWSMTDQLRIVPE
jgi:hypothetical protein